MEEQNQHLRNWEQNVADTRIHGTTRKQVRKQFEIEKPYLIPVRKDPYPIFEEGIRKVHLDGHIAVAKAYYSIPYEYTAREVRVRWDQKIVKIMNMKNKTIAVHPRRSPGKFTTNHQHLCPLKMSQLENGEHWLIEKAGKMGVSCKEWAQTVIKYRKEQGLRVVQGLISLSKKYTSREIDLACNMELKFNSKKLRIVRGFLKRTIPIQERPLFRQEGEGIRPMSDYEKEIKNRCI